MRDSLDSFEETLQECHRIQGYQQAVLEELDAVQEKIVDFQDNKALYFKVVEALRFIVEKTTEKDLGRIERLVTLGLHQVIEDQQISCKVTTDGASKVHITGKQGDFEGSFVDSFGGGVWNVASVILRLMAILRMKQRKRLFLDESLNNLHVSYLGNMGDLLNSLVEKLGFKALLITHQEKLAERANRVYKASYENGELVLERVK